MKQEKLFGYTNASGYIQPLAHQKEYSNAQSAIAYEKHKASEYHIPQKLRIKAYLLANPGSTLEEISAGTGIKQHGTITARLEDLRRENWDLLNDKGHWSIQRRIK